jgi:hypothetical protein
MISSIAAIKENLHCLQSLRQGGINDNILSPKVLCSTHRKSYMFDQPCNCILDCEKEHENEYEDLVNFDISVLHWGQMKLLLTELQFLTSHAIKENVNVVYAGSSPGHHLKVLIELMPPSWNWHLYDVNDNEVFYNNKFGKITGVTAKQSFHQNIKNQNMPKNFEELLEYVEMCSLNVYSDKTVKLENEENMNRYLELYTKLTIDHKINENKLQNILKIDAPLAVLSRLKHLKQNLESTNLVIKSFKQNVIVNQKNLDERECYRLLSDLKSKSSNSLLLFISDIRENSKKIDEISTQKDMKKQQNLVLALQPKEALLKFKLPYANFYQKETIYFDGHLILQPYSPPLSHECRLHVIQNNNGSYDYKNYDHCKYSKSMFYFQTNMRTSIFSTKLELPDKTKYSMLVEKGICIDHCFDCNLTQQIIENFFNSVSSIRSLPFDNYSHLLNWITTKLFLVEKHCGISKNKHNKQSNIKDRKKEYELEFHNTL